MKINLYHKSCNCTTLLSSSCPELVLTVAIFETPMILPITSEQRTVSGVSYTYGKKCMSALVSLCGRVVA